MEHLITVANVLRWGDATSPHASPEHLDYLNFMANSKPQATQTVSETDSMCVHSVVFDFAHAHKDSSSALAEETTRSKYSVFATHNGPQTFSGALAAFEPTLFVRTKHEHVADSPQVSPETAAFHQLSPDVPRQSPPRASNLCPISEVRERRDISPKTFQMVADWYRTQPRPGKNGRPRIDSAVTFEASHDEKKESIRQFNYALKRICKNLERLTKEIIDP